MTANECLGGYFEACPGGKTLILMKGRGVFWSNLIMSRGETITNCGVQGGTLLL